MSKDIIKKVSIILCTFNGSKWIQRAIESVKNQSFENFELIIINDASTDKTENLIREYLKNDSRIIYFKNEINLGIQRSRNIGLDLAKGEAVAVIDDDDEWIDSEKIKKQVDFLNENKDFALVGTSVVVVDENNREIYRFTPPQDDEEIRKKILFKNCFAHSSVLFLRDVFLQLGGYSESKNIKHIEDYDLILRLGTYAKFKNLNCFSLKYMSRKNSNSVTYRLEIFKKNIELIKQYRNKFPNFYQALFFAYFRFWFFRIFSKIIPDYIMNKFIAFYKKN